VVEELVLPIPAAGRQLELFLANRFVLEADRLVIVDAGNQRIVFASRDFELLSSAGRKGYGPGEYQFPATIVAHANEYYVPDASTKRISVLSSSGEYLRGIPLPDEAMMPTSLGLTSDGRIFVPIIASANYLSVWDPETGRWSAAVPRHVPLSAGELPASDYVLVTEGDTIHVLDSRHAVLTKVSPTLEIVERVQFPEHVMAGRRARARRTSEALGGPGRAFTPLFFSFRRTADGALFASFPYENVVGAVIDPHSYSIRVVTISDDLASSGTVGVGGLMDIVGDTLWTLDMDRVRLFRISQ
jgi:hypothetical protein